MKMIKFKDFFLYKSFNKPIDSSSVSVTFDNHTLEIRFNSSDVVTSIGYLGSFDVWLSSLCYLVEGKSLDELIKFSWQNWENVFLEDQTFLDLYQNEKIKFSHKTFELLRASVNVYRGCENLYHNDSPLVCRCFGVKEREILNHLKLEAEPTLETLGSVSKAGMGCRSCISQLKRWFLFEEKSLETRYYKGRPIADWIIEIDHMLLAFPKSFDWKMEVAGLKRNVVTIIFDKDVNQVEEEITGIELQEFLSRSVDLDLSFFLSRALHLSNASG